MVKDITVVSPTIAGPAMQEVFRSPAPGVSVVPNAHSTAAVRDGARQGKMGQCRNG